MSISLSASFNATSAFFAEAIESATIGLSGLGLVRPVDGSTDGKLKC